MPDPTAQATLGPMGMTSSQASMIQSAIVRFGSTPFTIGMLCETTNASAKDCIALAKGCHELGVLRCPVNDGGHVVYEVMPELVHRAQPARR